MWVGNWGKIRCTCSWLLSLSTLLWLLMLVCSEFLSMSWWLQSFLYLCLMCAHIWVLSILCSSLSRTSLSWSRFLRMLGTHALPDICPGVVWWFDQLSLRWLELLVLVVSLAPEVPLPGTPSPCTTDTGVETARYLRRPLPWLGQPPSLSQRPLGLPLSPLLVLDPAPPAESCCAEDN